jgi:predicted dehydrogenase
MSKKITKVGIIGCGVISTVYLKNSRRFRDFEVVAVADKRIEAAKSRAAEYGVPKACSVEDLLADPNIEIVVNLTPHRVHGQVGIEVLKAKKHLYNEKPLAVYRDEGKKMLEIANREGLRIGAAPDTFFGGVWQTARKLIDDGLIGDPVGAMACLMARVTGFGLGSSDNLSDGYTSFYQTDFFDFGVTWIFDRGPYYLTALINLLGPVRRVAASARKTWDERGSAVRRRKVNTPTHIAGIMDFANDAVGTLLITSDVYSTDLPHIEIYGSNGSLRCVDPNNFNGQLYLRKPESRDLVKVDCQFGNNQEGRGFGIADMASAIRLNRPHRANGKMAYHIVDIINALHEASNENRHIMLSSTCDRPDPLPSGLPDWTL